MKIKSLLVLAILMMAMACTKETPTNQDNGNNTEQENQNTDPKPEPKPDTKPDYTKVKIGDIFYSDGSVSTEYNAEKTAIGIVFWVGNPCKQDKALAADFPECTHGLVVSLREDISEWQIYDEKSGIRVGDWIAQKHPDFTNPISGEKLEDPINKINGYGNTKSIKKYNDDPENTFYPVKAIKKCEEYEEMVAKAPKSTSGWYLPSAKELTLMCYGETAENIYRLKKGIAMRDEINKVIAQIPKSIELHNAIYWASNEYKISSAYNVFFKDGDTSISFKETKGVVRTVLAF